MFVIYRSVNGGNFVLPGWCDTHVFEVTNFSVWVGTVLYFPGLIIMEALKSNGAISSNLI